jgi:hypothetical protein
LAAFVTVVSVLEPIGSRLIESISEFGFVLPKSQTIGLYSTTYTRRLRTPSRVSVTVTFPNSCVGLRALARFSSLTFAETDARAAAVPVDEASRTPREIIYSAVT